MSGWCYFDCLIVFENNLAFDKIIETIFLELCVSEKNCQVKEPRKIMFWKRALGLFCIGILVSHKKT